MRLTAESRQLSTFLHRNDPVGMPVKMGHRGNVVVFFLKRPKVGPVSRNLNIDYIYSGTLEKGF